MAADPIIYCLEHLTDYDQFERLCHDLMAAEGFTGIEPLGGMKDKGRDAIHVDSHDSNNITIFAYSVREDWRNKLGQDCAKIKTHCHKCQRVVFLCTATFTANERDEAVSFVKEVYQWDLDLYGLERLRVLLSAVHPNLIANHPQVFSPPFFPQAGGLTVVQSPDYLIIDFSDADEVLARWLSGRLTLAGYKIWCRLNSPVGGSSLNDTIETLIRFRAFRLLTILSSDSISDPDLSARRSLAISIRNDMLLPIRASLIDVNKIDGKTRSLEMIPFDKNWADGLRRLLEVLAAGQCPQTSENHSVALRAFLPQEVITEEPEILYSNMFRVLTIPEVLRRFTSTHPMEDDAMASANLQWAFRRVDSKTFISFHHPPESLRDQFNVQEAGGSMWRHAKKIDGIETDILIPELLKKSLQVLLAERGFKFCSERSLLYYPEGLLKSDRFYFAKPNGSKTFVTFSGERTYWRPGISIPYKYQLAPGFWAIRPDEGSNAILIKLRLRFTDQKGGVLPPRTALSRRKHLCKNWWNDDWFYRILAVIQFLSTDGKVVIGKKADELIAISLIPDHWNVSVRINERILKDITAIREEALAHNLKDEDEPGDE